MEVFVAANEVCPRQYLLSLPSFDWLMGCWDQRSQQPIDSPPSEEIFATLRWAADWWTPNLARGVSLQHNSSVFIRIAFIQNLIFNPNLKAVFGERKCVKKAKNVQKLTKLTINYKAISIRNKFHRNPSVISWCLLFDGHGTPMGPAFVMLSLTEPVAWIHSASWCTTCTIVTKHSIQFGFITFYKNYQSRDPME